MIYKNHQHNDYVIILRSFLIISVIQIIPSPLQLLNLPSPSWMNLLLIFWITKTPNLVNIGTGFIIGLITDIITGPILGVRAMILSTITYLLITKFPFFDNLSFWKQGSIITLSSLKMHTLIHILNVLCISNKFSQTIFIKNILLNSIIDGITWIGIFFIMSKMHTYYYHNKMKKYN